MHKKIFLCFYKFIIPFILLIVSFQFNRNFNKPILFINKQNSVLNFNFHFLNFFNIGLKRFMADILWIQTLIESDLDHYKAKDLNSWMYLRFDVITSLDKYFFEAYIHGGKYLSIIKDDAIGAKTLFEKGLKIFPEDYYLNFYSGFNYYFELNDPKSAYNKFLKIKDVPGKHTFLKSLTARLKAQQGDLETSYLILQDAYENEPVDGLLKKIYLKNLNSLKTEIDLKCLNSILPTGKKNCPPEDLLGNPYLKNKMGKYVASQPWTPYRPFKNHNTRRK